MSDETKNFFAGAVLGLMFGAIVASAGWATAMDNWKNEAVRRGKAEYYFNIDYEKQWRWLP